MLVLVEEAKPAMAIPTIAKRFLWRIVGRWPCLTVGKLPTNNVDKLLFDNVEMYQENNVRRSPDTTANRYFYTLLMKCFIYYGRSL